MFTNINVVQQTSHRVNGPNSVDHRWQIRREKDMILFCRLVVGISVVAALGEILVRGRAVSQSVWVGDFLNAQLNGFTENTKTMEYWPRHLGFELSEKNVIYSNDQTIYFVYRRLLNFEWFSNAVFFDWIHQKRKLYNKNKIYLILRLQTKMAASCNSEKNHLKMSNQWYERLSITKDLNNIYSRTRIYRIKFSVSIVQKNRSSFV